MSGYGPHFVARGRVLDLERGRAPRRRVVHGRGDRAAVVVVRDGGLAHREVGRWPRCGALRTRRHGAGARDRGEGGEQRRDPLHGARTISPRFVVAVAAGASAAHPEEPLAATQRATPATTRVRPRSTPGHRSRRERLTLEDGVAGDAVRDDDEREMSPAPTIAARPPRSTRVPRSPGSRPARWR